MRDSTDTPNLLARLSTLSDMARLRMLRLLNRHELSVGELARALQMPQSTVSRHLKLLHDGGWLVKRQEGTASLYQLYRDALHPDARSLWEVALKQLRHHPIYEEDDARLGEVLATRRGDAKDFFGRIGGEWDELRRELFGVHFTQESLLDLIDERWTIADLGCGAGHVVQVLAPLVRRVIAIDREPAMLEATGKLMDGIKNVDLREGELTELPVRPDEINAAVVSLVMHHIPDPKQVMREISRVLKTDGIALVIDMVAHDREEYRRTMGHHHLGFAAEDLEAWAESAKLKFVRYRRLRPDMTTKGPGLFAALLRKSS